MTRPSPNPAKGKKRKTIKRFVSNVLAIDAWRRAVGSLTSSSRGAVGVSHHYYKELKKAWNNEQIRPGIEESDIEARKKMKQCIGIFFLISAFTLFNFATTGSMYSKIVNGVMFVVFVLNMTFCYLALRNITRPNTSE